MGYGNDPAIAFCAANDSANADRSVPNGRTYDGAGDKGDGTLSLRDTMSFATPKAASSIACPTLLPVLKPELFLVCG